MKKIYAKPSLIVVKIMNVRPIAVSLTTNEAAGNAEVLSRGSGRNSSWDDDED